MPFGTFFAALFFTFFGLWLLGGGGGGWGLSPVVRISMAALVLSLAVALLLRRGWARWTGFLVAVGVAALDLVLMAGDTGVAGHLAFLGAVVTGVLLAVPATGAPRVDPGAVAPRTRPLHALHKALVGVTGLALVGVVAGLWVEAGRELEGPDRRSAALAASEATGRVMWTDFGAGIEEAEAEGLPVLVNFVANWCGYCTKMDKTTWSDPAVVAALRDFVPVRVDVDDENERNGFSGRRVAGRFGIAGTPTLVLLDRNGRVYSRISGYQTAPQVVDWLDGARVQLGSPKQARALSLR